MSSWRNARAKSSTYAGVGLGLRWDFIEEALASEDLDVAFLEISQENYMERGGYFPRALEKLSEKYRFITHGLTMSLGARDLPDSKYLDGLRGEIQKVKSPWHSDHLCLATAGPFILHELLPLCLCESEADRVAERIQVLQDKLGVPLLFENISYYANPLPPQMSELDFILRVLERSDAGLLLDVNNVFVNATNHGFDAWDFLRQIPAERVVQIHIAGHLRLPGDHIAPGMLLDTHGAPVALPVYELLERVIARTGPVPVLLERDNEVPPLDELLAEVERVKHHYQKGLSAWSRANAT